MKANAKTIEDNLSNTYEVSAKLTEIDDRSRMKNLLIEGIKPFFPMFHFHTRWRSQETFRFLFSEGAGKEHWVKMG